ncbi:outer membrane protein assembly factor BamD [Candidatus Babeliales bacterium]|nr:outer membrane protein assembly factor BamD [Candidatus Babeliales bacterium]
MINNRHFLLYSALIIGIATFSACGKSTKKKEPKHEQIVLTQASIHKEICLAQKEKNDVHEIELLEHAIQDCPESSYLATYNLRLADLYLEKDRLTQAYHIYDNFALLHPTHIYAEYASYKAIVAQFRQTLKIHRDCDSTTTEEAVKLCNNFLVKMQSSQYTDHVQDILNTCNDRLIEKETYIFQQYIQEGKIQSAEKRLAKIKKHFLQESDEFESNILFLECLLAQAEGNEENIINNIELLQEKYPTSPFTLMAANITKKLPFNL